MRLWHRAILGAAIAAFTVTLGSPLLPGRAGPAAFGPRGRLRNRGERFDGQRAGRGALHGVRRDHPAERAARQAGDFVDLQRHEPEHAADRNVRPAARRARTIGRPTGSRPGRCGRRSRDRPSPMCSKWTTAWFYRRSVPLSNTFHTACVLCHANFTDEFFTRTNNLANGSARWCSRCRSDKGGPRSGSRDPFTALSGLKYAALPW